MRGTLVHGVSAIVYSVSLHIRHRSVGKFFGACGPRSERKIVWLCFDLNDRGWKREMRCRCYTHADR